MRAYNEKFDDWVMLGLVLGHVGCRGAACCRAFTRPCWPLEFISFGLHSSSFLHNLVRVVYISAGGWGPCGCADLGHRLRLFFGAKL